MNDFVRNALQELKEIQNEESIEYDELKKLVVESKNRTATFVLGNTEIRIRSAIPKELKNLMVKVEKATHDELSTEEQLYLGNYFAYNFLAGICLDKPYTDKAFWKAYDDEVGDAQKIATEIIERLSSTEEKIIKFRSQ